MSIFSAHFALLPQPRLVWHKARASYSKVIPSATLVCRLERGASAHSIEPTRSRARRAPSAGSCKDAPVVSDAAPIESSIATPTREIARGVAWLAGTAVAVRLVEVLVGRSPLGAALAGAVIVDLAMTRAGVRWDARQDMKEATKTKRSSSRVVWQGIGIGVAVACVLVIVPFVLSVIVGAATVRAGSPSSSLVFGLLRGVSVGVRDELLLRGLPLLVAMRAGVRLPIALGYAALAGTSSLVLTPGLSWEALLLTASQGALFAMLWARTNAAWASVSAHATWVLLVGVGLRGGIVEVSWTSGMLADGARARGLPALVCVIVSCLLVAFVSRKLAKYSEASHGRLVS
jgi:hypothetical protein